MIAMVWIIVMDGKKHSMDKRVKIFNGGFRCIKTAKNIFVVTKVCPKKHRILNNLSILSHNKYNWQPLKDSPEGLFFEGFFGDTRDQMGHIGE